MAARSGRSGFDRREFLRRSALTAVAASATGAHLHRAATVGAAAPSMPALDAPGRVTGVTADGARVLAVGEAPDGAPAVWSHRLGERGWRQTAGASAFPAGAVLSQAAALGGAFLVAGAVARGHERAHAARASHAHGAASGHAHGEARHAATEHATEPAIFRSADGARWDAVLTGLPGVAGGSFAGIAAIRGRRALAVGSRFAEPDVQEGYGIVAAASSDGVAWAPAALDGVVPPAHGSVTMLADVGDGLLVGTNGFTTTGLFLSSYATRSWRRLSTPRVEGPVTFVAAARRGTAYLLAGIDHLDEARLWRGDGVRWRETSAPRALRDAKVTDLERVRGALVAAGFAGDGAVVSRMGVRA